MLRILLALSLSLILSACGPSPEEAWEAYQAAEAAERATSAEFFKTRGAKEAAERKALDAKRWRNKSRENFQAWKAAKAEYDAADAEWDAAIEAWKAASEARNKAREAWQAAEE